MNFLVFGILVILFIGECVNCVKIQFFREDYFTGLNYESNSTAKCTNIPADNKDVGINSIKTDTCLMVYDYPNCKGISKKIDLNNTIFWAWQVGSFHICNDDIGGPQLKMDITMVNDYNEATVLESYRNVCTCINVPQYVQDHTRWSINNFGNDFLAYYQPNCSENKWKAELVPAGFWCHGSRCMHQYEKTDKGTKIKHKIQSIGPDPNSTYFKTSCEQVRVNNQTADSVQVENVTKVISRENLPSNQQKQDQHFSNLDANNDQLEKQTDSILTENEALQNANVELESNQANLCRRLENSIEKPKNDFDNFAIKLDDKLNKLDNKLRKLVSG